MNDGFIKATIKETIGSDRCLKNNNLEIPFLLYISGYPESCNSLFMRIVQVRLDLDAQCQQIAQPLFSFSFVNFAENPNFPLEKKVWFKLWIGENWTIQFIFNDWNKKNTNVE